MVQNITHAVMSQRHERVDSPDDFPTHPWAVRAFCEKLEQYGMGLSSKSVWEPACGRGHMVKVLSEYALMVTGTDKFRYSENHEIMDFLRVPPHVWLYDWVITNPPFNCAEEFILQGLRHATMGVAMLVRMPFLETIGRYERLYSQLRPSYVFQYVERVPMHRGRLLQNGSSATAYCWVVWNKISRPRGTQFDWIAPSRARLQKDSDYTSQFLQPVARQIDVLDMY